MLRNEAGRLTALAYLMMLTIGVTFSLAGVTTKDIAGTFGVDTYVIGYIFTLFTAGYSLAILGNGFLLERLDIRKETLVALGLAVFSVLGATHWVTLGAFSLFILLYGVGLGLVCSIAYFIMVNLHDEAERAVKLNILNFFFSIGAIISPAAAGVALQQGVGWRWIYQATLILVLILAYKTLRFSFAVSPRQSPAGATAAGDGRWGAPIYITGAALLCYVVSETIFGYWVVLYILEKLALEVSTASFSLSLFWAFVAVGRLISGPMIAKFSIVPYILVCSLTAFLAFALLLYTDVPTIALLMVSVMGLTYAGLYPTILSYGTLLSPYPSSRLTTFFLTIGAGSGILSFLLSSYLKQLFGVTATMALAAGLMAMVTVFIGLCARLRA